MKPAKGRTASKRGYTIVELAFVLGIFGLVLGSIIKVFDSSKNTYRQGSASARVQNEARRAIDRVAAELENAGSTTLLPNPVGLASYDQAFQVATGVDAATGLIVFGASTRLRFIYEPGETNNGLDDDGDRLVDEGCIELTRNYLQVDEQTILLARGISELLEGEDQNGADDNANGLTDERGFCITREGNLLRLRVTMVRPVFGANNAIATMETAIRLKN